MYPPWHRRCILVASGAVLACPLAVLGQQTAKVRRIGFLHRVAADSDYARQNIATWVESLRQAGWEVGRNLEIEWRFSGGRLELLDDLAQDLVRSNVEVLMVGAWPEAVMAAKRATRTLPIVGVFMEYPVELGIVDSLARPGGNVTGTVGVTAAVFGKQLQMLRLLSPRVRRLGILINPAPAYSRFRMDAVDAAAQALGMTTEYAFVSRPQEVAPALAKVAANRPDALIVVAGPVIIDHTRAFSAFIEEQRLLAIGSTLEFVELGVGVFSYYPSISAIGERTVYYVDRILRGARPADLPIEGPMKFELVVNAKAARQIGIELPREFLVQATRVIE